MNNPEEDRFRALFHVSFRADEDGGPSFDHVWAAASLRHHRHQVRVRLAQWTALAALLVVGAFILLHAPSQSRSTVATTLPWRSAVLLSEWRAPTDTLLSAPESAPLSFELHP